MLTLTRAQKKSVALWASDLRYRPLGGELLAMVGERVDF